MTETLHLLLTAIAQTLQGTHTTLLEVLLAYDAALTERERRHYAQVLGLLVQAHQALVTQAAP